MGKETFDAGSELLIDSIKGNNIESKLDKRIKIAKQRIADSIEDGINMRKRASRQSRKYSRLDEDKSDFDRIFSNNRTKRRTPKTKMGKFSKIKRAKNARRTVFD